MYKIVMRSLKLFIKSFPFNLNLGTARRIQYTLNNTDRNGYNPPPCFQDWPRTDDDTGAPWKWTIKHCPNLVCRKTFHLFKLWICGNKIIIWCT